MSLMVRLLQLTCCYSDNGTNIILPRIYTTVHNIQATTLKFVNEVLNVLSQSDIYEMAETKTVTWDLEHH